MKPEVQLSVAIPLRCAIWNWVEWFPEEFQESLRIRGRGENAPERVYDVLHTKDADKNPLLWPTLTALMCISSVDRISSEYRLDGTPGPQVGRGKVCRCKFSLLFPRPNHCHSVEFCWDVEQSYGNEIQIRGHRGDLSFGFRSGCNTSPAPKR